VALLHADHLLQQLQHQQKQKQKQKHLLLASAATLPAAPPLHAVVCVLFAR
jgi:hypothetical protein